MLNISCEREYVRMNLKIVGHKSPLVCQEHIQFIRCHRYSFVLFFTLSRRKAPDAIVSNQYSAGTVLNVWMHSTAEPLKNNIPSRRDKRDGLSEQILTNTIICQSMARDARTPTNSASFYHFCFVCTCDKLRTNRYFMRSIGEYKLSACIAAADYAGVNNSFHSCTHQPI